MRGLFVSSDSSVPSEGIFLDFTEPSTSNFLTEKCGGEFMEIPLGNYMLIVPITVTEEMEVNIRLSIICGQPIGGNGFLFGCADNQVASLPAQTYEVLVGT